MKLLHLISGILFLLAGAVMAVEVFSSFGPDNGHLDQAGYGVLGSNTTSSLGFEVDTAASFIPAEITTLDFVDVAVINYGGTNEVQVRITEDDGGVPDTSFLQEVTLFAASTGSVVRADFDNTQVLQAGQKYWIWLSAPGDANTSWLPNNVSFKSELSQAWDPGIEGGGTWGWTSTNSVAAAFRVVGISSAPVHVEISLAPKLFFSTNNGSTYSIQAADAVDGTYAEIGTVIGDGLSQMYVDTRELSAKQFYKIIEL